MKNEDITFDGYWQIGQQRSLYIFLDTDILSFLQDDIIRCSIRRFVSRKHRPSLFINDRTFLIYA